MSVLPILPQGFVVGRILTSRGDSADADKQADTAVVVGMVDFTPSTAYRKLDATTVVTHSKITAKLDSHGDLHPQREASDTTGSDTEDGIWLPVGTWKVTYRLNAGMGALPEHNIEVTEAHTEAAPLPLFANMGDAPQPGASYVTMQVPLNGQPGHYLVLNGEGSGLAWASGVLPETISDAVEDYLVANPPASAPDATTTVKGLVELATTAEATAGTDTTRAVTPAGVAAAIAGVGGGVTDHGALSGLADDDHTQYALADGTRGAFAAPLGADDNYVTDAEKVILSNTSGTNTGDEPNASETVAGIVELATTAEATTGTDTQRAVTPEGLKAVADTKANATHSHTSAQVTDFTEATQDVVGGMVAAAGGTYDDAAGTITLPSGGGGGLALSQFYVNYGWAAAATLGGNAGVNLTSGRLFPCPQLVRTAVTATKVGIHVETAAAGSSVELALYTMSSDASTATLVATLGTVDTSTTGPKMITGLSQPLAAGAYVVVARPIDGSPVVWGRSGGFLLVGAGGPSAGNNNFLFPYATGGSMPATITWNFNAGTFGSTFPLALMGW